MLAVVCSVVAEVKTHLKNLKKKKKRKRTKKQQIQLLDVVADPFFKIIMFIFISRYS